MAGGEKHVFSSYDPQNKDAGNQEKIERLKKNKHKSKLLQGKDVVGKYKDEVSRDDVINGVTQTILHHMQQANQQSADETTVVKTEVLAMKSRYEGELNGLEATAVALQAAKDEKSRLAPLPANARTGLAGIFKRKSNEEKAHKAADDKIEKNEKSYDKKKKDLISKADKDFQKLDDLNKRHDASITEISNRYDDQAMKYYQLNRDNPVALDADHIKNIQQYIGYLPLERVEFEAKLDAIKQSPGTGDELTIKAWPAPKAGDGIDADPGDSNILHHKYIKADLLDKGQGQIDVSSGEFKPVGQIKPDGEDERDLKMDDFKANEKYRSGNYRVSASSLDIHRVKAKKGTVYGVTIGGEFISQNRDLYDSIDDARFFQQGKLDAKKGRYAQTEKIADYIQRSDFFNHVFSENIEEYMKYEGNERELNEQIKTEIPDVANASITIQDYKKESEENILKSMYIEIAKGTNGGMQDANEYVGDILGKVSFSLKHTLVPKLVRLLILIADNNTLKDTALQIAINHGTEDIKTAAQAVLDANADTTANNAYHFVDLLAACDESSEAPEAFQKLDAFMNFMTDEGAGDDDSIFKGLINWEEISGVLESAVQTYDLASGIFSKIEAKEKAMESMDEESDEYTKAKKELDKLNAEKTDGFKGGKGWFGNVPKLFGSALAVISGIKDTITTFKEGKFLSDEHSAEAALQSKYITVWDKIFDVGSTIVGLIQAIFDLTSTSMDQAGEENEGYGIWMKVLGTIVDSFNIAKNVYNIVQSGRTMHEVSKSMDTITAYTDGSDQAKARDNNPQVLQFLAHSRQKAGKDIALSSVDIVTGAVSIAGNFVDPVTEAILGLVKKGIGTVGKLITNFVYNKVSEKETLKAAFPREDDFKEVNRASSGEFDSALQKTTGIKSKKSLAQVSRIFSAIDLHVLMNADDDASWKLAKDAMGAFYNFPNDDSAAKAHLRKIPLSALLSKVGEEGGWRSALQGALV